MEGLMGEFTKFMSDAEGNEEMKAAFDSVIKDVISKDSLYEPMKTLKEEYPKWLEENADKLSYEELEKYNKQLDKIEDICKMFESSNGESTDAIFEQMAQLQELGQPPQDLMRKIGEKTLNDGKNPYDKI